MYIKKEGHYKHIAYQDSVSFGQKPEAFCGNFVRIVLGKTFDTTFEVSFLVLRVHQIEMRFRQVLKMFGETSGNLSLLNLFESSKISIIMQYIAYILLFRGLGPLSYINYRLILI